MISVGDISETHSRNTFSQERETRKLSTLVAEK